MLTLPNFLSFLRIPLAFLFLEQDTYVRAFALLAAMATDFFDGFLARRYRSSSQVGATLDPITDKFFVTFVLAIFLIEGKLQFANALAMLARDGAVFLFGLYLLFTHSWNTYKFHSIWCGKITTTLQLFVLFALTFNQPLPAHTFTLFILLGVLSFLELYIFPATPKKSSS